MNFLDLAKNRFSVRKFKTDPISEDSINKIVEAAIIAPTACNNQPIKIYVLESCEAREKIKKCTNCHFDAPLVMLICYDKTQCWTRPFDNKTSGDVDASIVTTHMMLEAASLGIGSTWVMFLDPNAIIKEFNLPNNIVPVSLLPMGYMADGYVPSPKHSTYKSVDDIVIKL